MWGRGVGGVGVLGLGVGIPWLLLVRVGALPPIDVGVFSFFWLFFLQPFSACAPLLSVSCVLYMLFSVFGIFVGRFGLHFRSGIHIVIVVV